MFAYRGQPQYHIYMKVIDNSCRQSESFKRSQITINKTQAKREVLVKLDSSTLLR